MGSTRIAGWIIVLAALACGRDLPETIAIPAPRDTPEQSTVPNETDGGPSEPATATSDGGVNAPLQERDVEITIERRGALGYCPADGMVLSAGLSSSPDALFQGTRATAGDLAREDCLDPWMKFWSVCLVAEDFGPVLVSPAQLAELRKRAAAVPEYSCEPYFGIACDPCLVTTITIGDRALTDHCCGRMKKKYRDTFSALASFLDELAATALDDTSR